MKNRWRPWVAVLGMLIGAATLLVPWEPTTATVGQYAGAFVLLASFCYLLGIKMPNILGWEAPRDDTDKSERRP